MITPINSLNTQNNSYIPSITTIQSTSVPSSSTARSSMRRMRTETTTTTSITTNTLEKDIEYLGLFYKRLTAAMEEARYEDALVLLDEIDSFWNQSTFVDRAAIEMADGFSFDSSQVKEILDLFGNGAISALRGYLFAMTDHPDAIAACDAGFEKLQLAFEKLEQLDPHGIGSDLKKELIATHYLLRGLIELSLQSRELAVQDLRKALELDSDLLADTNFLFLAKILEQKLQTPLFPEQTGTDEERVRSLFIAGRYEEVLELLAQPRYGEKYSEDEATLRAACFAFLGRYDEALSALSENNWLFTSEQTETAVLIEFLKGNSEEVKQLILHADESVFNYFLVLLALKGF